MNHRIISTMLSLFLLSPGAGFGDEPQPTPETVAQWHRDATLGMPYAQHNIGLMYAKGDGVRQDFQEAFKWFRLSAEQGFADAQDNMGDAYFRGEGVPRDYRKAFEWYRMSAVNGYNKGQHNLALMYLNGYGVRKNREEAKAWFSRACQSGLGKACDSLRTLDRPEQSSCR